MTRLFLAILIPLAAGCAAPRATVIEETPKKRQLASNATAPELPAQGIGLRDPDVVSELPADTGMRSPAPVPPSAPDDRPTVIARPPSDGGGEPPSPPGTN